MKIPEIAASAAQQLADTIRKIDSAQTDVLAEEILKAKRVYVTAAGRSLLVMRCFAMRLMQIGIMTYVVGDTTTPAFGEGDLLIAASSSGETATTSNIVRKAKSFGGRVAILTIKKDSTIGKMADSIVEIPAYSHQYKGELEEPILPGGCLFEQSVLLVADTVILPLTERLGETTDTIFVRHANLE